MNEISIFVKSIEIKIKQVKEVEKVMEKPLRHQETAEEFIVNMDEELFDYKKKLYISLVVGIILIFFIFGGIPGMIITVIGLFLASISGTMLYIMNYRHVHMENWVRKKYERQAQKKGKRLVITYNPEGQQFYPHLRHQAQTQTQRSPSTGFQPVDTKAAFCPKCGNKVEQGYKFCMHCSAELT